MYEFEGFAGRLHDLRKQRGMTQEELASRVGVTGQAVSKWENGQAYPDITLLPTLATILGTEIDHLFGKKATLVQSVEACVFPSSHTGMPIVHNTQYVACYSNKEVLSVDNTGVKFKDGSTAELTNRMVVNMGQGEILFLGELDNHRQWHNVDPSVTKKQAEFGPTQNLDISVYSYACSIIPSKDEKTRVNATGDALFIASLQIKYADETLCIDQLLQNDNNYNNHDNKVIIELPGQGGNNCELKINGSGSVSSEIDHFKMGHLAINGSGFIKVHNFDKCNVSVNGSGDVKGRNADEVILSVNGSGDVGWGTTNNAKVNINGSGDIQLDTAMTLNIGLNGSGDITVNEITGGGDCTAKVTGSGDIQLKKGRCENFDVELAGSGVIDATELTAREANIILHQDGSVVLGRVLERSVEQIKNKGRIKILQRGQA